MANPRRTGWRFIERLPESRAPPRPGAFSRRVRPERHRIWGTQVRRVEVSAYLEGLAGGINSDDAGQQAEVDVTRPRGASAPLEFRPAEEDIIRLAPAASRSLANRYRACGSLLVPRPRASARWICSSVGNHGPCRTRSSDQSGGQIVLRGDVLAGAARSVSRCSSPTGGGSSRRSDS